MTSSINVNGLLLDIDDPADMETIWDLFLAGLVIDHEPSEAGMVNGEPVGERDGCAVAGEVGP